jgi:hypothetical protein
MDTTIASSKNLPQSGVKIYTNTISDDPLTARPGEPLPRPFVVATMPYAKWLILESSAQRMADAEAKLAAMTESSQRNAALADSFEKQLVAERAKNAPTS